MSWQDEIFEVWWEDNYADLHLGGGIKTLAREAFHRGWDAAEDR